MRLIRSLKHSSGARTSKGLLDAKKIMLGIGLKKGDVVLDAGCGNGFFAIEAGAIIKNSGTVYAIDSSMEAHEFLRRDIAQKNITYVRPICADISTGIPVDSAIIDAALLVNVLRGLADNNEEKRALKEIYRALKPGGLLGIVDAQSKLPVEDVIKVVTPYCFKLKKQFEAGPWHYCLVFNKI